MPDVSDPQTMIDMRVSLQFTGEGAARRTRFLILDSDFANAKQLADAWLLAAKGPQSFTVVHDLRVIAPPATSAAGTLSVIAPERPAGFAPKAPAIPEYGPIDDEGIVPGTTTGGRA